MQDPGGEGSSRALCPHPRHRTPTLRPVLVIQDNPSLLASTAAVTVVPLLPPQPTSITPRRGTCRPVRKVKRVEHGRTCRAARVTEKRGHVGTSRTGAEPPPPAPHPHLGDTVLGADVHGAVRVLGLDEVLAVRDVGALHKECLCHCSRSWNRRKWVSAPQAWHAGPPAPRPAGRRSLPGCAAGGDRWLRAPRPPSAVAAVGRPPCPLPTGG